METMEIVTCATGSWRHPQPEEQRSSDGWQWSYHMDSIEQNLFECHVAGGAVRQHPSTVYQKKTIVGSTRSVAGGAAGRQGLGFRVWG